MKPKKEQRDTQNIFDVAPASPDISPSVKSVGIYGQITGSRADVLIADDVEIPTNSGTQVQRDKLSEAVREFDSIINLKDLSFTWVHLRMKCPCIMNYRIVVMNV